MQCGVPWGRFCGRIALCVAVLASVASIPSQPVAARSVFDEPETADAKNQAELSVLWQTVMTPVHMPGPQGATGWATNAALSLDGAKLTPPSTTFSYGGHDYDINLIADVTAGDTLALGFVLGNAPDDELREQLVLRVGEWSAAKAFNLSDAIRADYKPYHYFKKGITVLSWPNAGVDWFAGVPVTLQILGADVVTPQSTLIADDGYEPFWLRRWVDYRFDGNVVSLPLEVAEVSLQWRKPAQRRDSAIAYEAQSRTRTHRDDTWSDWQDLEFNDQTYSADLVFHKLILVGAELLEGQAGCWDREWRVRALYDDPPRHSRWKTIAEYNFQSSRCPS